MPGDGEEVQMQHARTFWSSSDIGVDRLGLSWIVNKNV
jgi:hypothetical protein